jgi:hypothetical protein
MLELKNDDVIVTTGYRTGQTHSLDDVMEIDHVIRSNGDGTVSEVEGRPYAPEVCNEMIEDLGFDRRGRRGWALRGSEPWALLYNFTGQDSYNGPVMHDSESIGGGLARAIKEEPGYYAAVAVYTIEPEEGCEFCESETANEGHPCPCDVHNIVGWAVAYQPLDEAAEVVLA